MSTYGNLLSGSNLGMNQKQPGGLLSSLMKPKNSVSPSNLALMNKTNPSPLSAPLDVNQAFASGGLKLNKQGSTPVSAPKPAQSTTQSPTTSSSSQTGDTSALQSALKAHLTTLQSMLKDQQAREANTSNTPTEATQPSSAFGGLIKQGTDAATKAAQLKLKASENENDVYANPNYSLDTQVGRAGLIDKNIGQQLQGLSEESNAAFTGANAAAPVLQFGQLTDPTTGKVIGAGSSGNNPALDSAVQNALKIAQTSGPSAGLATLSGYGQAGVNSFNQAMLQSNPGYNPNASDTIATQNNQQGADFQSQAAQLDIPIKALDDLSPKVLDFMTAAGINKDSPQFLNSKVLDYWRQTGNPGAATQYEVYVNELKKYMAQVLGASGKVTPTEITDATNKMDPTNLSPKDFEGALAVIRQVGQINKNALQSSSSGSYSAGTTPFSGTPANIPSSITPVAPAALSVFNPTNNPDIQAGLSTAGDAAGIVGSLYGLAQRIFSK